MLNFNRRMVRHTWIIAAFTVSISGKIQSQQNANFTQHTEAKALVKRILPKHAAAFEIQLINKDGDNDVFELESKNGKIILRGNNGVAIGSALQYYLKNFAHCHTSWNGNNLNLPAVLPQVKTKIRISSPHRYRYNLNYCTFNYTMSWWDWERWEKEIDWMALNGINMPLAITGQNSIWNSVYKSLGFTTGDLQGFFSGPAYFNWFWMGNLDGWGGPLPESFMKRQETLQKKILARQRALGMTPILPAFTGHVPPSFTKKFPSAHLKKTNWQGFPDVYILDPDDSMFTVIGKKFTAEMINTFGTDHLYSADTFNENTPPTNDSLYLDGISKKVYQSMSDVDPKAMWIMQGWMFSYSAKYWQPTQIKALLNAVPDDNMIILDLYSESKPMWNKTEAYYRKPWIWCMLHNFGGNISLYGRMNNVANDPVNAKNDPNSGKMVGIGLTPEAIEQNPVIYELMLEHAWNNESINLDEWLRSYSQRRYGAKNEWAEKAWIILKNTVYNGGISSGGPESIIVSRPTLKAFTRWANTRKSYQPRDLVPALTNLLQAAKDLKKSEGFQYDLVDVTRQVLANYADTLQRQFIQSWTQKDTTAFKTQSQQFLGLIDDLDKLLATKKDFLLGQWLNAAKRWEQSPAEKGLYERNARNLITLWGDKNSVLHEYSNRQWSGLLTGFYKPRWQQFFNRMMTQARQGKNFEEANFEEDIKNWEWNWVNGREIYPDRAAGDPVATAGLLWNKYKDRINNIYSIK
jgi:alpha-N-acetylglucosaminidase